MPEDEITPEELAAIEAADAYLDAVGGGLDIPDDPLGASELRQGVDREPLAWPNFPSAHTARGETLQAITGGTPAMSISEDAAVLAAIGNDQIAAASCELAATNMTDAAVTVPADSATAVLNEAAETVANQTSQAVALLGTGTDAQAVQGAGQQAQQAMQTAIQAAQHAAKLAEEARAAIGNAITAANDALAAVQGFYGAVAQAAGRHGS